MNVLVVAAHPDDEVLGCGGTISVLAAQGACVHIAILGEGITSRFDSPDKIDHLLLNDLHAHCRKAVAILGANVISLPIFPDNRMDTVPLLDIAKHIEKVIGEVRPEAVYTHHFGDMNIDHSLTFRAVMIACRPKKGHPVKDVYSFEVPSSTEWSFGQISRPFNPNVFVDISKSLEEKKRAMRAYLSETTDYPHPRSIEAIEALARVRGATVGMEAAEGFELMRSVRNLPF